MENPKISIIVPVYNAEKYLEGCLNSLLAQSFDDIEVLCVNDGSSDRSLDILKTYEKINPCVRVFDQKNSGPAKARNVGLENARGEFIMFCDADDTYCYDMCKEMITCIKKNNVDFVMCHINTYDKQCKLCNSDMWFPFYDGKKRLTDEIKIKTNVYLWNKIFRKSIIDVYDIKFPEGHKSDDNAFVYEYLAVSHNAYYLAKKLYNHFDCDNSIMNLFYSENIALSDLIDKPVVIGLLYAFIDKNNILQENKGFFSNIAYKELRGTWQNVPVMWENDFLEKFSEVFSSIPEQNVDFSDITFMKLYYLLRNKDFYAVSHMLDMIIKATKNYRRKYCVQPVLKPAFEKNNVCIVFNSDDNYVKYLAVAVQSILCHVTQGNNYDIVILNENISEDNQLLFLRLVENLNNVSIRFYDMNNYSKKYKINEFKTIGHVKTAAYYRLFLSEVFKEYEKIIYLDSDLILNADIANLIAEDLEGKAVAAVKDYHVSQITEDNENQLEGIVKYAETILKLSNLSSYFNSGVLVCDIKKIKESHYMEKFIEVAKINNKYFNDQNVLNSVLQGDIKFLDKSWNVQLNGGNNLTLLSNLMPISEMKIIHYCGKDKVWNMITGLYPSIWWAIARQSICYELLLKNLLQHKLFPNNNKASHHLNSNHFLYWKYKILSKITFGERRKKYKDLKKEYKNKVKAAKLCIKPDC